MDAFGIFDASLGNVGKSCQDKEGNDFLHPIHRRPSIVPSREGIERGIAPDIQCDDMRHMSTQDAQESGIDQVFTKGKCQGLERRCLGRNQGLFQSLGRYMGGQQKS